MLTGILSGLSFPRVQYLQRRQHHHRRLPEPVCQSVSRQLSPFTGVYLLLALQWQVSQHLRDNHLRRGHSFCYQVLTFAYKGRACRMASFTMADNVSSPDACLKNDYYPPNSTNRRYCLISECWCPQSSLFLPVYQLVPVLMILHQSYYNQTIRL